MVGWFQLQFLPVIGGVGGGRSVIQVGGLRKVGLALLVLVTSGGGDLCNIILTPACLITRLHLLFVLVFCIF